jgi:hypothetical protein
MGKGEEEDFPFNAYQEPASWLKSLVFVNESSSDDGFNILW